MVETGQVFSDLGLSELRMNEKNEVAKGTSLLTGECPGREGKTETSLLGHIQSKMRTHFESQAEV